MEGERNKIKTERQTPPAQLKTDRQRKRTEKLKRKL